MTAGNLKILSDLPIERPEDAAFGFGQYSKALASVILDIASPITIGVFGKWGTGKTSLMRMMYNELDSSEHRENVFPVWFNAWRYENEEHLALPLLYTIKEEIDRRQPTTREGDLAGFARFLDKFIRALGSGLEGSLNLSSLTLKYSLKDSLKAARELAKEVGLQESTLYHDAFRYLEHAIAEITPVRLVVFVDDLDRCVPDKLLQVLEAVKLMLDFPGLVFVVGVDRTVVERAVTQKYGIDSGVDGSKYIRKLIQVSFTIPALRADDIQAYVRKLTPSLDEHSTEAVAQIVEYGIGSNPREIKRFVNNFSLVHRLNPAKTVPQKTALLLALQQRWPTVYEMICEQKVRFLEFGRWFQERKAHGYAKLTEKDQSFLSSFSIDDETWEFLTGTGIDPVFQSTGELDEYLHFASIASFDVLQVGEIGFQHVIEHEIAPEQVGDPTRYLWRISPVASNWTLERVEKIIYRLPASSYLGPERATTISDKFSITDVGWSNIDIHISVCLKSGEVVDYTYHLDLGTSVSRQAPVACEPNRNIQSEDAQTVLEVLESSREALRKAAIVERSGIAEEKWRSTIKELLDSGKVVRLGRGRGTMYKGVRGFSP